VFVQFKSLGDLLSVGVSPKAGVARHSQISGGAVRQLISHLVDLNFILSKVNIVAFFSAVIAEEHHCQ
jgi:hypothetical protein